MLRYSLTMLVAVFVAVSIYCAGLSQGNWLWPQICLTLTLMILSVLTLSAVFSSGDRKTYAIGFCVVGWLYFIIAFSGLLGTVRDGLLTHTALDVVYQNVHLNSTSVPNQVAGGSYSLAYPQAGASWVSIAPQPPVPATGASTVYQSPTPLPAAPVTMVSFTPSTTVDYFQFMQIGHGLFTVLLALAGGFAALLIDHRRKRGESRRAPKSARQHENAEQTGKLFSQQGSVEPTTDALTGHPLDSPGNQPTKDECESL